MIKYQHCKTFQAGHFCCKGLTLSATQITSTGAMSWCSPDQTITDGRHRCTAAQSGMAAAPSVASCCTPGIFFINDLVRNNKGVSIRQHTRESGSSCGCLGHRCRAWIEENHEQFVQSAEQRCLVALELASPAFMLGPSPAGRLEQASKHV